MISKPDPSNDLRDATQLSGVYTALAVLYRQTPNAAKAETITAQRRDLWQQWDHKLPGNPFVLRQLASVSTKQRNLFRHFSAQPSLCQA